MDQVGPLKKFRTKRAMWEHITNEINKELNIERNYEQVQNRHKTLMRKRKLQVDHNRKCGNTLGNLILSMRKNST